ncbi:phosphatidylinositol glycan, class V [Talaromyces islandicus]|uniref:GPI mannosyltransferase 2 n=1 Tax=Talaromyces islandicus TaxID=28573 RepID=A0A0U1LQZ0_TALIS|nr:phosphatidylinositol glycan, class V [Talaromyces islandicus]
MDRPPITESAYAKHPIRSLAVLFVVWKALLFLVVAYCPGPGYDTSTTLLTETDESARILKFVRWDAIYFVRTAERGYLFEQEWAFSYGYLLRGLISIFNGGNVQPPAIAVIGVILSHVTHFVSVLVLYHLTKTVLGSETARQRALCFVSAALHVTSPAGAFLSAPYGEPVFSCLNLTGLYVYSSAILAEQTKSWTRRDLNFVLAGVLFAGATLTRSNGILSGALFAYDAVLGAVEVLTRGLSFGVIRRTAFVVLGGSIVALGMIVPQYIAFKAYCLDSHSARPWCERLLPSIYSWVQVEYWNNGFLTYWTVSNLPLFLLAAPILTIMFYSALVAVRGQLGQSSSACWSPVPGHTALRQSLVLRLAIPQGILAVMALTNLHVQIINRICSGYPVWYWFLAALGDVRTFGVGVKAMALYAGIQAVLFGSFLPPA